jgi:hypothetical protein
MALDWQVLVIAFIATSLRLLAIGREVDGAGIDGRPSPLANADATHSINIMAVRQRGTDDIPNHPYERTS